MTVMNSSVINPTPSRLIRSLTGAMDYDQDLAHIGPVVAVGVFEEEEGHSLLFSDNDFIPFVEQFGLREVT